MPEPWEIELAALSRRLDPEAAEYWDRHHPRFRYLARLLGGFSQREGEAGQPRLGQATPRNADPPLAATHPSPEGTGDRSPPASFRRLLDVGMSYETPLLARLHPGAELTCLGLERDERFAPEIPFRFIAADLDDLARGSDPLDPKEQFDLIVCMEVIEHLTIPPEKVFAWFARHLTPQGLLLITTPNAAWLKNRLKLLRGRNPFELLSLDPRHRGHIREYTLSELHAAGRAAGLAPVRSERRGLYHFRGAKDRFYNAVSNVLHPSLRRTLVAIYRRAEPVGPGAEPAPAAR